MYFPDQAQPSSVSAKPYSTPDVTSPATSASERDSTYPASTTHIIPTGTHEVTSHTTPVTLNKPVLDLNVTAVNNQINDPRIVAALSSGEAAVLNFPGQVVKINNTGHTVKELYKCQSCHNIYGLYLLGSNLYVFYDNGTIVEIQSHTGKLLGVYRIHNVMFFQQYGSLWLDPSKIINNDILLLADSAKGEVFSYNLISKHKQVHLSGLSYPISVSYSFYDNSTHYVVCQHSSDIISVHNSSWELVSSFGGPGTGDGYLRGPFSAIMTFKSTVIVSDANNNRISVFTTDGVFLYHLFTQSDGINGPTALSYHEPYLWAVNFKKNELYRYRLV